MWSDACSIDESPVSVEHECVHLGGHSVQARRLVSKPQNLGLRVTAFYLNET
ncbi:hypothetical protein F4859DRAFT_457753 [Xylaria cf. heliscus]|nr:hypothetical protein F4859DRAFT_457753 [Xylaria cf. heliscus]